MSTGETPLLDDPVAQQLLTSRIPARLAYNWTDGTPRVVPIWFHWTGEEVVFGTMSSSPKTKAIADGAALAVTIDSDDYPHKVLMVRGTASVRTVDGVVEEYARAAERYMGEEAGRAFVGQLPPDTTMLRIALRPEQVRILDFQTRFPSALSG